MKEQNQSHQDQAGDADDRAHADEVENQRIAKKANQIAKDGSPFTLTNCILTIMLFVFTTGGVKALDYITSSHDAQIAQGIVTANLVSKVDVIAADVKILTANCMTQDAVDKEIKLFAPQHSSIYTHGAENLVNKNNEK